ncbi:MAG TPA: 2-C-methyl-D-erythritol 4-phosphate cytidylyltransferase [Bacteroidota bacterium]|nr:2-C-methyl-D-erythritol 4-phosphate cytidylyltransferase [Bacteroidota bacterium]
MRIGAVIPCAGRGLRMGPGDPKQFLELEGKPIIAWAAERLQSSPVIESIVIAAPGDQIELMKRIVSDHRLSKVCAIVAGGARRQDSVRNGLRALNEESAGLVLIHDGVRPFVDPAIIESLLAELSQADAAIVGVRAKDTIKLSDGERIVRSSPSRDAVWIAQTPQLFRRSDLCAAFERAESDHFSGTDEATLIERLGKRVAIVEGSYDNIKVTTPEDLELARIIARRKQVSV